MYDACDTKAIWLERENLQFIQTNKLPKQNCSRVESLDYAREFFIVVSLLHVFKELIGGFSLLYALRHRKGKERTSQLVISELICKFLSHSHLRNSSSSRFAQWKFQKDEIASSIDDRNKKHRKWRCWRRWLSTVHSSRAIVDACKHRFVIVCFTTCNEIDSFDHNWQCIAMLI